MFSSTQEIKLLQTTRKKKLYAFAIQVVFPFHEDLRETEKQEEIMTGLDPFLAKCAIRNTMNQKLEKQHLFYSWHLLVTQ